MKLPNCPWLLIDEFPKEKCVSVCIFTRAQYPIQNQKLWAKNLQIVCPHSVYRPFRELSKEFGSAKLILMANPIGIKNLKIFQIKYNEVGSPMLVITFEDDPKQTVLYSANFTNFKYVKSKLIPYMDKITDLHIDNTLARIEHFNSVIDPCEYIVNKIKEFPDYKFYLSMDDLFGYEEILIKLAREHKLKIQLHLLQSDVMAQAKLKHLFEFEGETDLTVYFNTQGGIVYQPNQYEFMYKRKMIFIKFIACEYYKEPLHKFNQPIYIPYSPHPSQNDLLNLLTLIKPERVHPLINRENDLSCLDMPEELIPQGCKLSYPTGDIEMNEMTASSIPLRLLRKDSDSNSFLAESSDSSDNPAPSPQKKNKTEDSSVVVKEVSQDKNMDAVTISDSDEEGESLFKPNIKLPVRTKRNVKIKIENETVGRMSVDKSSVILIDGSDENELPANVNSLPANELASKRPTGLSEVTSSRCLYDIEPTIVALKEAITAVTGKMTTNTEQDIETNNIAITSLLPDSTQTAPISRKLIRPKNLKRPYVFAKHSRVEYLDDAKSEATTEYDSEYMPGPNYD